MSTKRIPLLFLSDSPDCPSGLARIGRDLAVRVHNELPQFRVGYLGRGGFGGNFPYPTWVIPHNLYGTKTSVEWGSTVLPQVWQEFAGDQPGIVFTIWDPARMIWLSQPKYLTDSPAKTFLEQQPQPFQRWGYFPVDGETPSGGLGLMASEAIKGYDRVLAYTPYGAKVLEKANWPDGGKIPWIPHGLDAVWHPRDKQKAREHFLFPQNAFVVGVVATNQRRKDWGIAGAVGRQLKDYCTSPNHPFRQWWHVDAMEREWSIPAVLNEFGLEDCTMLTTPPQSDDWMATAYSCCDVTLAIGSEGFGYPIVESQACGVPVVHGDYAGGAFFVPRSNLIDPLRDEYDARPLCLDGLSNIMRMVYDPEDWTDKVLGRAGHLLVGDMSPLRWEKVWPQFKAWFLEGL